jgi:predicted nuclease of restriction endonuclease-like RecB superfamily
VEASRTSVLQVGSAPRNHHVGFWTPDYVARKLALYRSARLSNLILCIDENRNCAEADFPSGALVVRFRRRVDAAAVLRVVETTSWPC